MAGIVSTGALILGLNLDPENTYLISVFYERCIYGIGDFFIYSFSSVQNVF